MRKSACTRKLEEGVVKFVSSHPSLTPHAIIPGILKRNINVSIHEHQNTSDAFSAVQ